MANSTLRWPNKMIVHLLLFESSNVMYSKPLTVSNTMYKKRLKGVIIIYRV